MSLSAGTRLGPYEILSPLGAGGMGEVYRARDLKLGRDVAVKVLPAVLAGDAQYMARFEREAQVLASLNHPNIAAVYGVEQGALVMELVPGQTLAERIAAGAVPVEEALPIARQIAAGLEAAHDRGIVHRDLKPANVKITPDGLVKLLDFGLAKTADEATSTSSQATISPTLSMAMTQAGTILGTAAYMSPEQARGKPVDRRTDIWSFGVVLYEMLKGRALFASGETVTDIIAAVVTREPDWNALPAAAPPHIRRLLEGDSAHPKLGKPEPFLTTPSVEVQPVFSPDGRWIAGKPSPWSDLRTLDSGTLFTWDMAPDGKRLAAFMPSTTEDKQKPITHLTFLLNFSRRAAAAEVS